MRSSFQQSVKITETLYKYIFVYHIYVWKALRVPRTEYVETLYLQCHVPHMQFCMNMYDFIKQFLHVCYCTVLIYSNRTTIYMNIFPDCKYSNITIRMEVIECLDYIEFDISMQGSSVVQHHFIP